MQPTPTKVYTLTPQSRTAVTQRRPVATWLFLAFGWALFALWWRVVLTTESLDFLFRALAVVGIGVVVVLSFSLTWVGHNKRLARKGRRGLTSRYIAPSWERDAIDRPVNMPPRSVLERAAVITVSADGQTKRYDVERWTDHLAAADATHPDGTHPDTTHPEAA